MPNSANIVLNIKGSFDKAAFNGKIIAVATIPFS